MASEDIIFSKLRELQKSPAYSALGYGRQDVICLTNFIKSLAGIGGVPNLGAIAQFKNLLDGLTGIANEAITAAQLVVSQMETTITTLESFIGVFKSGITQALNGAGRFPFSQWETCRPVQAVKTFVTGLLPKPNPDSLLPGNARKLAKKYRQTKEAYREAEQRIFRYKLQIRKINRQIDALRLQVEFYKIVSQWIKDEFGV